MSELRPPLLVYDRIAANLRRTRLLLVVFGLSLLPALLFILPWLAEVFLMLTGIFAASALGQMDGETSETQVLQLFAASMTLAVISVVGIAYLHLRLASAIVLRISGASRLQPGGEMLLQRIVENLTIGAGLPMPKLYVVESTAPNLFSTGLDPGQSSLVVTRGLLALLEPRELEGVVAHELVQIGNRDTRLGTVLAAGTALLRLPAAIAVGFFRLFFKIHPVVGWGMLLYVGLPMLIAVPGSFAVAKGLYDDGEKLPALLLLALTCIYTYVLFLAPLLGQALVRAVSRERVRLSDADAVLLTRDPAALARALVKIDETGQQAMKVNPAVAHLYFVDPRLNVAWWEKLIATHPAPEERVAILARMASFPPSELEQAREAGRRFAEQQRLTISSSAGSSSDEDAGEETSTTQFGGAFRIDGAGAALYAEPRAGANRLAKLRKGDIIVIQAAEGDFLRVLTTKDKSGFILRSEAGQAIELDQPPK